MDSEFLKILKEKNIILIEEIIFKSDSERLLFLNKLNILLKNSSIEFMDEKLKEIILKVNLSEKNLNIFKKLNWDDFKKTSLEKNLDKKKIRVYENFIYFLNIELEIISSEEKIISEKNIFNELKKDDTFQINSELFKKNPNFDIEIDLKEKISKYGIEVLFDYTVASKKLGVSDFTLYFNRRLDYFTNLLKSRISMDNVMRISQLRDLFNTNMEVSIIGLISEINKTQNGHFMITLEDKSSQIKCFINKDKTDLIKQIENFCLDEGIGIKGKIGNNIIWTDEFVIPTPPNSVELKRTEEEHYVLFLSDIHFGAKVFVEEAFNKLIDFLNGRIFENGLDKIAEKVKYIIVAGDIIEGIGVYPNQGLDAKILSTELQYNEAAMYFSQIPKRIGIIMIPGNHDTDRLSEPQPKLPYEKAYALYNMKNVMMLSNPSIIKLFSNDANGGLDFYLYHGGSLFYYADKIQYLREKGGAKVPEEVVKFLLEKRHLAPSHGSTLYIPDSQNDPLVIKNIPDFFITGHTHKLSLANYKGCTIISCGCWVEMSDYQEKMGMYPDIGKSVIVNTKTRKPKILNFYIEKYKREENKKE